MAYCNISDAFNINSKFEDTVKGMRSFNPATFEMSNVSNSYGKLTNIEQNYDSPYSQAYDNCSQSLNGTDLSNLINNSNQSTQEQSAQSAQLSQQNNSGSNQIKVPQIKKLTHRDCIGIYTNPKSYSDDLIANALKHITKCSMCKSEIKKMQNNNLNQNLNTQSLDQTQPIQANQNQPQIPPQIQQQIQTIQQTKPIQVMPVNSNTIPAIYPLQTDSTGILESKLQQISNKISEENNLKYQNAVLQNTISKYMEDAEEKKQFNCKVDKILELLQQKQNQINQQMNQMNQTNQMNQMTNPLNPQYPKYQEQFMNYPGFRPEMFGNYNNNLWGIDWMGVGIVVIIILLFIDVYLRIKNNNSNKSE